MRLYTKYLTNTKIFISKVINFKTEECGAKRRPLPLNFFAFSGKPSLNSAFRLKRKRCRNHGARLRHEDYRPSCSVAASIVTPYLC
ncbi:MAG: hypothetical protein RLZZ435_2844 [Cyanobacteriota bacterium]|jgi:hypothetical protein